MAEKWRDYDVVFSFQGIGSVRVRAGSEDEAMEQAEQAAMAFDGKDLDMCLEDRMHGVVVEDMCLEDINDCENERVRGEGCCVNIAEGEHWASCPDGLHDGEREV